MVLSDFSRRAKINGKLIHASNPGSGRCISEEQKRMSPTPHLHTFRSQRTKFPSNKGDTAAWIDARCDSRTRTIDSINLYAHLLAFVVRNSAMQTFSSPHSAGPSGTGCWIKAALERLSHTSSEELSVDSQRRFSRYVFSEASG